MQDRLPPPLDAFIAAVNAGDLAALDLFAEDGAVDDWGRRFVGREAIRRWSDREFIGARGTMAVGSVDRQGETVIVEGDWKSDYFSGHSRIVFTLGAGRILEMRIVGE